MGISILQGTHSEAAPHQPLQIPPAFKYFPDEGDSNTKENTPVCKLRVALRNHQKYEGDSGGIIYGTLEVSGQPIAGGAGFTFWFDDVKFKDAALDGVWSIRASIYVEGQLAVNGEMDLHSILVCTDPVAPLAEPVEKTLPSVPADHTYSTF